MTIRNLQYLFNPGSVAVIGASKRPHSIGANVLQNLVDGGFRGTILPVNPKYDELLGFKVYGKVGDLPQVPELAIICTPPATLVALIKELGSRGTKAVIILSPGLEDLRSAAGGALRQAMLAAAKPHLLRIMGPNCVGLLVPALGLNASFAHTGARPGKIAFVSQSGALVSGVLDWAQAREIGFSKFISLGESIDIDVGDVLDYLAGDNQTHAILLYIEDIRAARKFMSAARAAARGKPVIVLKTGRTPEAARVAAAHSNALAGSDEVYDAAIRRAGMLRVFSTDGLFDAVETLARARPVYGDRLAIMTNGGGLGVIATDALMDRQGHLAELSETTLEKLGGILPKNWSHANPVDILRDAPIECYVQTLEILLQDGGVDAVLFLHAPTAAVPSADIAQALAPLAQKAARNVLACWLGGATVSAARHIFSEAGIPTYSTPEKAVFGFMQIVQYRRNQELLMEAPASASADFAPDRATAQAVVQAALGAGRSILSEPETKSVLAAYGIPVVETRIAYTVKEALRCAQEIGFPVALKILAPEIHHKSDVGGVALDLETPEALRAAAAGMRRRIKRLRPDVNLQGFTVQAMMRRPDSHELIVGVTTDPVFGPVILFGQGGVAVEVTADHALTLPPLNMVLARELVMRTRVAKLLVGYRNSPPAALDAICRALMQVAQLATDMPEVIELDINPLLADAHGVIALDARLRVATRTPGVSGSARLAIRPYPEALEEWRDWRGERLLLRPIKPEDSPQHLTFFNQLDADDVRFRTFSSMRELDSSRLARLTQIDYDREMAFIATREVAPGQFETLGVVRAVADPDNISAEFAIIVRSDMKGKGLGHILFKKLIDYFRQRGTQEIVGDALAHNKGMQELVRRFGFEVIPVQGEGTVRMVLDLRKA
jgi:acetyltransferase